MLDKERVLVKLDELNGYLNELKTVLPDQFADYRKIPVKRSCERLIQLSIETLIDVCKILVSGMRLGVPGEENDLFDKLQEKNVFDQNVVQTLKRLRGFRNILVHEYADVDDELVFKHLHQDLSEFNVFTGKILTFLKNPQ